MHLISSFFSSHSILLALLLIAVGFSAHAQEQPGAYRLFTHDGQPANYQEMLANLTKSDLVFFGELHNNPISHWLQQRISEGLYQTADSLVIGAEMFEADDQLLINEYFNGLISKKRFEDEARLWPNYQTDYQPLLEFAKTNQLRFIATNIPRRYASAVYKEGLGLLDSLSELGKQYIAPLPINVDTTLSTYRNMQSMAHGDAGLRIVYAQSVKDATMAHFILKNMPGDGVFLHINGNYHSKKREGIVWYVEQQKPAMTITTIATVQQEQVTSLDSSHIDIADYILCVPEDMTKTH